MNTDSGILIVGGGIAGITAALGLLDQGIPVTLLDRDTEANFGGLAVWSMGGLFFVDSPLQRRAGIRDSAEMALQDWLSYAEYDADAAASWPARWAEAYVGRCTPEVYEWLKGMGLKFIPAIQWLERGLEERPGNRVPRFHMVWGLGKQLMALLCTRLKNHAHAGRLSLLFRHRVDNLIAEGGRIAGLSGTDEATGRPFEYRAAAVIVAAGGITGSDELLRKYWDTTLGPPPPVILNGAHRFGDGRLLDTAKQHGAQVTHLDKVWNYAAGIRYPGNAAPYEGLSLVPSKTALWLDAYGERIGPRPLVSGFDTRFLVQEICRRPHGYGWQLLNRRIAVKELGVSGGEYNPAMRERRLLPFIANLLLGNAGLLRELQQSCPDVITAPSLPELADKMNALAGEQRVNAAQLAETVRRYDEELALGANSRDEQAQRIGMLRQYRGDKLRTTAWQRIAAPDAGPFIAIRTLILARKSLGGLQTDLHCRVLDRAGEAIPGLFAVGEAAGFGGGGIHGRRALEGTFLGNAMFSGRIAARTIGGIE